MTSPSTSLDADLQALQSAGEAAIADAESLETLEKIRLDYLGKKGKVSKVLGGMGKLPPEDRPTSGRWRIR